MISDPHAKRILYVTQWYSPEPEGPAVWIARALVKSGYAVDVLTGLPNYPTGKIYPGYSQFRRSKETIDGISVTRSPLYPSHDASPVKRVINYLSFAISATIRGLVLGKRADATLVYSSPATSAIPAMFFRMLFKTPYILLIQDLWPDSVIETGMLKQGRLLRLAKRFLLMFDGSSTKRASAILVISPGMKRKLVERGVPENKITLMYNWCDETKIFPRESTGILRRELDIDSEKILLLYGGNLGKAQALDQWLDALSVLPENSNLELVLIGNGTERNHLREKAVQLHMSNVHFLDSVPLEDFLEYACDADYLVLSLDRQPIFEITIPGKLQTSLAMGKPIVSYVAGDAKDLISDFQCGMVVEDQSIVGLIALLKRVNIVQDKERRDMAARAVYVYKQIFSESVSGRILRESIDEMIGSCSTKET